MLHACNCMPGLLDNSAHMDSSVLSIITIESLIGRVLILQAINARARNDCHNNIVDRKSMLDGGTNCGKGGTTMAAVHGPGGPLVAPCLVRPDHLRRG